MTLKIWTFGGLWNGQYGTGWKQMALCGQGFIVPSGEETGMRGGSMGRAGSG